jgi:hypothetical protein
MAEVLFTASAIYKNGQYVFNDPNNVIAINSPKIDAFSPREAWLLRMIVPGTNQVQYLLTFAPSSAELADPNTIAGAHRLYQQGEFHSRCQWYRNHPAQVWCGTRLHHTNAKLVVCYQGG